MAVWDKYKYEPGLTFGSKFSAYRFVMRPYRAKFSPDGDKIDEWPELVAEFATHGGEYTTEDFDGHTESHAMIWGHFFNLDEFASENDLTEDEVSLCAKRLLWACDKFPAEIWRHSTAKLSAPWPTYDTTPEGKIVGLAETLGLVGEALAYEQQNLARKAVVDKLGAAVGQPDPEPDDDEVLIAA